MMNLEDARMILTDILEYEVVDSIVTEYEVADSLNQGVIALQLEKIEALQVKETAHQGQLDNLNSIIENKDGIIIIRDKTINKQKKEIRKQKFMKVIASVAAIAGPILTLMAK